MKKKLQNALYVAETSVQMKVNLDQHIKSHDRDNDSPPPKKKKNMPLLKGTKSLLNHYSTAPKSLLSPISKAGTSL